MRSVSQIPQEKTFDEVTEILGHPLFFYVIFYMNFVTLPIPLKQQIG
jgi:hypothetical protein